MIQIDVQLFGALRQYGNGRNCELSLYNSCNLTELRAAMAKKLSRDEHRMQEIFRLLEDCAFASGEELLEPNHIFTSHAKVAVLPPVCGG